MDVTALLNENSGAVDQQRSVNEETYRLPTRSRTPWDADGYSLPLNTTAAFQNSQDSGVRDAEHLENGPAPTAIPFTARSIPTNATSPFHKLTDSRSSLSSFTSSNLNSTSHSRYSSISTLNSPKSLSISLSEQLLLSPNGQTESNEGSYFKAEDKINGQASTLPEHSPSRPLKTLAQIAERRSLEDVSCAPSQQNDATPILSSENQFRETRTKQWQHSHTRSISSEGGSRNVSLPIVNIWTSIEAESQVERQDAVTNEGVLANRKLNDIRRPSSPSDTLLIKRPNVGMSLPHTREQTPSGPYHTSTQRPIKSHKRALSAPDFGILNIRSQRSPVPHEPTPPGSNHPHYESPQPIYQQSPPATPPPATTHPIHAEPTCMYIDDCDTDSPQRKAISHIFGRNKMCTRMIPEHLWVHLCRKHYQRCRYRDQNKWAKVQCDLVQLQIRRIHDWSLENQLETSGVRLAGWSLTMRKREKVRREKAALAKRKRDEDGDGDDKAEDQDRLDLDYNSVQTQVPDWLVKHCDQEFSTQGILAIFNRLHQEVLDGRVGPQFPDIELLPNLVSPEELPKTKKSALVGPKKAHQRSRSMITPSSHESSFRDHTQKRQRREDMLPERVLHSIPIRQATRQPTYPSIHEDVESGYGPQMVAHQPQPRRFDGPSIAMKLESDSSRIRTRPPHQRSQSDAFYHSHSAHLRTSPSSHRDSYFQVQNAREYPQHMDQHDRYTSHEEYEYRQFESKHEAPRYGQYAAPSQHMISDHERQERLFGHHRHSSTPAYSHYTHHSQQRSSVSPLTTTIRQDFRLPEHRESEDMYVPRH